MAVRSRLLLVRSLSSAVRSLARPGGPSVPERLSAVPRLSKAVLSGEYRGMSVARLGLMAGALAYVVSPVDLMPEGLLLALGLADDAMVLSWLAATLVNATDDFLQWEHSRTGPGAPFPSSADGQGRRGRSPQDAPVSGHVVR